MVTVSNCSRERQYLVGVVSFCYLNSSLDTEDHR